MQIFYMLLLGVSILAITFIGWKILTKMRLGKDIQTSDHIAIVGLLLPLVGSLGGLAFAPSPVQSVSPSPTVIPTPSQITLDLTAANQAFARPKGLDEAKLLYERVVATDGKNTEALVRLAQIADLRGFYDDCERYARMAIEAKATGPLVYTLLADALDDRQAYDDAAATLDKVVGMYPNSALGYAARAIHRAGRAGRDYDQDILVKAQADAEIALQKAQSNTDPYIQALSHNARGDVYYVETQLVSPADRHYEAAIDAGVNEFNRAIAFQPQLAKFQLNLGVFYFYQGTTAKGHGELARAEQRFETAQRALEEARDADDRDASVFTWLGILAANRDQPNEALKLYNQAISLNPTNTGPHIVKSRLLREQNNYDDALKELAAALKTDPDDYDVADELGWVYRYQALQLNGDAQKAAYSKAEAQFRRALTVAPRYVSSMNGLGYLLLDQERYEECKTAFEQVLQINDHIGDTHNGLGWCQYNLDKTEDALENFRRATTEMPDYTWAWEGVGRAAQKLGKRDEARTAYQRVLTLDKDYAEIPALLMQLDGGGELKHDPTNGKFESAYADVNLRDALIEATFTNPNAPNWDYGFALRKTDSQNYRLIVSSSEKWWLQLRTADKQITDVMSGTLNILKTEPGDQNSLRAALLGDRLFFFVNGTFVQTLNISAHMQSGDIAVATGLLEGDEVKDGMTAFADFHVRPLTAATDVKPSGKLPMENDSIARDGSDSLKLSNLVVNVRFTNPYDLAKGAWDYGIFFRDIGTDNELRLVVTSGQHATLNINSGSTPVWESDVKTLNTAPDGSNELTLIVLDDTATLFINDTLVSDTMDVSSKRAAGTVAVVAGNDTNYRIADQTVSYTDFQVWSIDAAK